MKVIRLNNVSNFLKVEPESIDDLYLLAIIISKNDVVEAHTTRRFRANERDTGEQKDVMLRVLVEKTEIDKNAGRLRIGGKIVSGKPEEFVTIGSYHTLNIAAQDIIDIQKTEWKDYILKRIRQAVQESKRPRLGVIVLDDEKALISYIKGYGIDIVAEIYSKLSKRMKEKDYQKMRETYFNSIIDAINNMKTDIVVLSGPGFTKDDIKKYADEKSIKINKQVVYTTASDAERSGIRETMQSPTVAKVLENEHMKKEFYYLNIMLAGLRSGNSFYGKKGVMESLESGRIGIVLVNDSVINEEEIKPVLDYADKHGVKIEIFNSDDDAGIQLKNFKDIAGLSKSIIS